MEDEEPLDGAFLVVFAEPAVPAEHFPDLTIDPALQGLCRARVAVGDVGEQGVVADHKVDAGSYRLTASQLG